MQEEAKAGNAPGFTIPLTIKRGKPGDTIVFECLPYGKPFPEIKWLKDGIEQQQSGQLLIEAAADGTQRLTVKNIDFFSEGYYRCVATNEYGTASTKAELIVEGCNVWAKPQTENILGDRSLPTRRVEELFGEPEECKPRIRRGLYNMSVHQVKQAMKHIRSAIKHCPLSGNCN